MELLAKDVVMSQMAVSVPAEGIAMAVAIPDAMMLSALLSDAWAAEIASLDRGRIDFTDVDDTIAAESSGE